MDSNITLQTKQMIDSLKAVCTNFGLGNASSEYKIITEVFLWFLLRVWAMHPEFALCFFQDDISGLHAS